MAKSITTKAREKIADLAKRGSSRAKSIAADALGAAATAATEVVLKSAAKGMERGGSGLKRAIPRVKRKVGQTARRAVRPKTKTSRARRTSKPKRQMRRRSSMAR